MKNKISLILLLLLQIMAICNLSSAASTSDSLRDAVVRNAINRITAQDAQNALNEQNDKSNASNYIITIDVDTEHWIEERGNKEPKILDETNYENISKKLRTFNDRKDNLRFYVIVVNDYAVKFQTQIDPAYLNDSFKWNDLKNYPDQQKVVADIHRKTSVLISDISAGLQSKGFSERIIYFYSQLKVEEYNSVAHFYKYDGISCIGDEISKHKDQLIEHVRVPAKGPVTNINEAVNSIINSADIVLNGIDNPSNVDCNASIDKIISNTISLKEQQLKNEVKTFVALIDKPGANQRLGSQYLIVDKPESFDLEDVFTREMLPDKLNLLASNSDYKLYVVLKEINFAMPAGEWKAFATAVAAESKIAKEPGVILMVVPYLQTYCTGKTWFGMPVGKGTGIIMPAVYASAAFTEAMNTALSTPNTTWVTNFNQAFKRIPKSHTVYSYSMLWNGDFIQHDVNVQKNVTGFENIIDIILHDDRRYEELNDAKTFAYFAPITPELLERDDPATNDYVMNAFSIYVTMVDEAMKKEELIKIKVTNDIKQSLITKEKADQYAHWVWREKTGRSAPEDLPFEPVVPDDEWFYGGVNKVTAEHFIAVLDMASFASSFVGLDVVFDSWQAYYAYDKGFYFDAAIATTAVAIEGLSAGGLKAAVKALRKGEVALVKTIFNKRLYVTKLAKDRIYVSFIPIVFKLNLDKILSNGLVSAITSKQTFLTTIFYARKADYKALVPAFEKAVAENTVFKDLINSRSEVVDLFFKHTKQKPSATVDEILELATLTEKLPKNKLDNFIKDFADGGFSAAVKKDPGLAKAWNKFDNAGLDVLRKDVTQLQKFDNIVKGNNLGLDADGLGDLLKAPTTKIDAATGLPQKWDNPDKVLDAVKRTSDVNVPGVSIDHKKFPAPANGTDNFVLKNAKQFQAEASGDAALSFNKGGVSFDNVAADGKLIDRKYGHGSSIFDEDGGVLNETRAQSLLSQAKKQLDAVGGDGSKIRWEISTDTGANGIEQLFFDNRNVFPGIENIDVVYVPQQVIIP
jgi:hypothetical protein